MNHPPIESRWRRVLFVTVVCLLASCAVSPEYRKSSLPSAVALQSGQGLVALRLLSNRGVQQFFVKWNTVQFRNVATGERTDVSDRADSGVGYGLFVASLPPGSYTVERVASEATGYVTIRASARATDILPTFAIREGQLTDLGSLAYFRKHSPANSREFALGILDPAADRENLLSQLDSTIANRARDMPVLGWDAGAVLDQQRMVARTLREQTMQLASPRRTARGDWLFGEAFGQVAIRNAAGQWRLSQTGTTTAIRTIEVMKDGSVLSGSDGGLLFVNDAALTSWREIPLPRTDVSVVYAGFDPEDEGAMLVVLQARTEFIAFSRPWPAAGSWKDVFRLARPLFLNPQIDARAQVLVSGDRFALVTGGVDQSGTVTTFDRSTQQWVTHPQSSSGSVADYHLVPGAGLGRFFGIPLTGTYFATSEDLTDRWQRRGDINVVRFPSLAFVDQRVAYVLGSGATIWRTDDAGLSWTLVGPIDRLATRLFVLGGSDDLAYPTTDGRFSVSHDGGRSWKSERSLQ